MKEDIVKDMLSSGKSQSEAEHIAIMHFKIDELEKLSKNSKLFKLNTHQYLLGFSFILALVGLFFYMVQVYFVNSIILEITPEVILSYFIGLIATFIVYKFFDLMLFYWIRRSED